MDGSIEMTPSRSKFFKGAVTLFTVLDVEQIQAEADKQKAATAVKTFALSAEPKIEIVDVLIAGGGMGGIGAALSLGRDLKVLLTEETAWLGGQMSAQGVAALDENKYVESTGATANFLAMRTAIRDYYRHTGKLTAGAQNDPVLNPGSCWVTRLAFEPHVVLDVLDTMLAPQIKNNNLKILKRTKIVAAHLLGDDNGDVPSHEAANIDALLAIDLDSGIFTEIQCRICIDATELGDIMPLAKIPYQTGSDSRWVTGEKHAPETADSDNVQDFTYPFILTYHDGENHTITKPSDYDAFVAAGKFSFDGYKMFAENTAVSPDGKERHLLPFWTYRRLIDKNLFQTGAYPSDVSMINWDSNDLRGKNILDKSAQTQCEYLALAKRVSLGFLYWLQTEAARDEGGKGYPELKMNFTLLGSGDGLSKYPYIREARRLAACTVVVEHDIVEADNHGSRARLFNDSCGIGLYPVDIHGRQEISGAAQQTRPFQVPASVLLTDYCSNFIAACKNIGVTHITNGAYRLHPIEWGIGTAAGAIARLAITGQYAPLDLASNPLLQLQLQIDLAEDGAPCFWFDDIAPSDKLFAAAQVLCASGIITCSEESLSFEAESPVSDILLDTAQTKLVEDFSALGDWKKIMADLKNISGLTRGQLAQKLLSHVKSGLQNLAATTVA